MIHKADIEDKNIHWDVHGNLVKVDSKWLIFPSVNRWNNQLTNYSY